MKGRTSHLVIGLAALATLLAAALHEGPASSEGRRRHTPAPDPHDAPPPPPNETDCNYQEAQPFLIRESYVIKGKLSAEERAARQALHEKSIEYRTKHYGYFKGFGRSEWNPHPPSFYARWTTFFGKRVQVNEQIVPALACVEQQIREVCADRPYQPQRLSGLRDRNTYHTGEVSNHVYGIGFDVDPTFNTCCGCVAQWGDHPLCKAPAKSVYDRMKMPPCWVHTFERFGFYWLGHDPMQDTMHFEFLGDPSKVLKTKAPPAGPPPGEG